MIHDGYEVAINKWIKLMVSKRATYHERFEIVELRCNKERFIYR